MEDRDRPAGSGTRSVGRPRLRAAAIVLLFFHLIGGALHGACGLGIHGTVPGVHCTMTDDGGDADAALPGHHCHGCFIACPVAAPAGSSQIDLTAAPLRWSNASLDRLERRPSTPPPKAST